MKRPALLDLFCCAGGAGMGYHRAGFDVTGVDVREQPNYPFAFLRGDALKVLAERGHEFDAIHASPPCQAFTQVSARWRGRGGVADGRIDLLTPTLAALAERDVPWVVENVVGARPVMKDAVLLHGGMFGLGVHRPRLFASNVLLWAPKATPVRDGLGVYGEKPDGRWLWRRKDGSRQRAASSLAEGSDAMGIDWMAWDELKEAIPPAYTEHIGQQLIAVVRQAGGVA